MILPAVLFSLYKTRFFPVRRDPGKRKRTQFVPNGFERLHWTSETILLWEGTLRKETERTFFKLGLTPSE